MSNDRFDTREEVTRALIILGMIVGFSVTAMSRLRRRFFPSLGEV